MLAVAIAESICWTWAYSARLPASCTVPSTTSGMPSKAAAVEASTYRSAHVVSTYKKDSQILLGLLRSVYCAASIRSKHVPWIILAQGWMHQRRPDPDHHAAKDGQKFEKPVQRWLSRYGCSQVYTEVHQVNMEEDIALTPCALLHWWSCNNAEHPT